MRTRLAALFDGSGWFVGSAAVLMVFALLVLILEFQSPDIVLWTGHRVTGTEEGGIVYYHWHGQSYTVDVPGYGSSKAVGVYLDPANPSHAMTDNAINRASVALLFGGPVAGAIVLLTLGLTRTYRHRRRELRRATRPSGYGHGLDPEFVSRRLREIRHGDKKVP